MTNQISFDIVPHVGIGPVRLGMSPDEVEAVLASISGALPRRDKGRATLRRYFGASLQVEFGKSGKAQFIGASGHADILWVYYGCEVFDTPAPELFSLISSREQAGPHKFSAAEYLFPQQVVTLYDAAEQYDRKGQYSRPVFGEVGIGSNEYLEAIRAIRARRSKPAAG